MNRFVELRQLLHRRPELAGNEQITSETIARFIKSYGPDNLVTGLGGHGLAATFRGSREGPSVLVRCELDALPIPESLDLPYRSEVSGASHKCGHDGHMATLVGLAENIRKQPLQRGSVTLLFQPAEESGEGAVRVLSDPAFEPLRPDFVLAIHNLPGYEHGEVVIRSGVFAAASTGLQIRLKGKTSHAAEPEAGNNPAPAVAQLIQVLSSVPQFYTSLHESAQVTIVHVGVGELAFGTSPGEGTVAATLRSHSQETMSLLQEKCMSIAKRTAEAFELAVTVETVQPFPTTVNDPGVVKVIDDSAREVDMTVNYPEVPFAWSEDFGHFTAAHRGALIGLGSGVNQPPLHHPDYDFPDSLLRPGITLLRAITQRLTERDDV